MINDRSNKKSTGGAADAAPLIPVYQLLADGHVNAFEEHTCEIEDIAAVRAKMAAARGVFPEGFHVMQTIEGPVLRLSVPTAMPILDEVLGCRPIDKHRLFERYQPDSPIIREVAGMHYVLIGGKRHKDGQFSLSFNCPEHLSRQPKVTIGGSAPIWNMGVLPESRHVDEIVLYFSSPEADTLEISAFEDGSIHIDADKDLIAPRQL